MDYINRMYAHVTVFTLFDFDAEAFSRSIVRVYPHGPRNEMVDLQEMEDHV